jgi:hypothetical protein
VEELVTDGGGGRWRGAGRREHRALHGCIHLRRLDGGRRLSLVFFSSARTCELFSTSPTAVAPPVLFCFSHLTAAALALVGKQMTPLGIRNSRYLMVPAPLPPGHLLEALPAPLKSPAPSPQYPQPRAKSQEPRGFEGTGSGPWTTCQPYLITHYALRIARGQSTAISQRGALVHYEI